jgi:hypothetical protein
MTKWLAVLAVAAFGAQDRIFSNSYKGQAPPEIVSEAGQWLNAKEALSLEKLRGRVVWLEFGFIN